MSQHDGESLIDDILSSTEKKSLKKGKAKKTKSKHRAVQAKTDDFNYDDYLEDGAETEAAARKSRKTLKDYEEEEYNGLLLADDDDDTVDPQDDAYGYYDSIDESRGCGGMTRATKFALLSLLVVVAYIGASHYNHRTDHHQQTVIVNDDDFSSTEADEDCMTGDDHSEDESYVSEAAAVSTKHHQNPLPTSKDDSPNDLTLYKTTNHEVEEMIYHYSNLVDNSDDESVRNFDPLEQTPFFFHVPRSGGTTLEHILGKCLGLVQASQVGIVGGHESDKELQVVSSSSEYLYVNVDTTSLYGLEHAKDLGLAGSGLADIVYTSFVYDAAGMLFSDQHRGRLFTLMRHPVERAVSMYYYLRTATWEETYDHTLQTYTLAEYAQRTQTEHNWMVRMLANVNGGQLYPKHLEQAKAVLKQKALIGLLDHLDDSIERFERFFGWDELLYSPDASNATNAQILRKHQACQTNLLEHGANVKTHDNLDRSSVAWKQLERRNWFDIELYNFAVELYHNQTKWFESP